MRRLGSALLPWAVLAVLACLCFARLVVDPSALVLDGLRPSVDHANHGEPRPVGNDATFVFLPHHLQVAKSLRAFGHLPAWDPTGFGGRPMIGNPQGGLFYPAAWLAWCLPYPAALCWLTVAHLLWGGAGVYLLARGQGLERWPATLAAGAFQTSPYLLAQMFEGHAPHVWSACWFPWAFLAYLDFRSGRSRGLLALPPILALTALAGHPQECFLLVVALSVWASVDVVVLTRGRSLRAGLRCLLGWCTALALGPGLAAIELVPDFQVLPWSSRATAVEAVSTLPRNYVLQLWGGLQLFSPWALGGPADFFGPDNYWETVFSFGLVSLVLIAVGTSAIVRGRPPGGRPAPAALGWVVLAVASAWFAAGPSLGLFSLFHNVVPGMGWFRVPGRSLFLTALAAAMLAGFGLQALARRLEEPALWRRFAVRLATIGGLIVGLLLLAVVQDAGTSRNAARLARAAEQILRDPVFTLTLAGLAASITWGCVHHRRWRMPDAIWFIGLLALSELAIQGHALLRVTPASELLASDPISEAILKLTPSDPSGAPPRVRAHDRFYLDLQAVRHGIEKTNVNDVFQLAHAAALYEHLYAVATTTPPLARVSLRALSQEEQQQIRQGVFDRMAVSFLVSDRVEYDPAWPVAATGRTHDGRAFFIQRNPTALPRAYVVPRAKVVVQDAVSMLRRFITSDPRQSVLMEIDPLASLPPTTRQPFTSAQWSSRDPDRPVLEVTTSAPGLLVIADTWMPGWSAQLDGLPAPILRGNHCQRVIPLETAGPHRIELRYDPPGLALGGAVSLLTAVVWVTLATVFSVVHRRRTLSASTSHPGPEPRLWTKRRRTIANMKNP
jgi:hypothetical protein